MVATSRWQLLGFKTASSESNSSDSEWVVTYFASTLFTPAGLDIYSRNKDGLSDEFIEGGAWCPRGSGLSGERRGDVQSPARLTC
jgi:hypothetical protein